MNDSRALIVRESLFCFIYQSKKFIEERKLSIKKLFCFSFVVRTLDKIRCINNDQYFSTEKKNETNSTYPRYWPGLANLRGNNTSVLLTV